MDIMNEYCQSGICTMILLLVLVILVVFIVNMARRLIKVGTISRRVDNIISLVCDTEQVTETEF